MSITAQVDTASIEVSLDMHELRNEIRELVTEELDSEEAHNPKIKQITADIDNIIEHHKELLDEVVILKDKVSQLEKRNDELTARIVGAGCMLTGTRV